MKLSNYLTVLVVMLFISGCSSPELKPVKVEPAAEQISFLDDVKPILDKRCVSCHSCYNAACQTKFSSFEGIDRGGSKKPVYNAVRLSATDPTRLFVDARSTDEWRQKGFYSVTQSHSADAEYNDSIMMHMLYNKRMNPEIVGTYAPERDKLLCPGNKKEMNKYADKKPNHGMPYGLPQISDKEYYVLSHWLQQGAKGPSAAEQRRLETPSPAAQVEIDKWESFLNRQDAKHSVTARYLYEHLFLAHWHFTAAPGEFYKIVRSRTPSPEPVDIIATVRPFDDPGVDRVYYRLVKIHATIVNKTHMVVEFDDAKLARINDLFIAPEWTEKPHHIDYSVKASANPFVAFFQIPVRSRYQFLLDNSEYVVRTFIRGPVCRGQVALNVIHDHFWVMFQAPEYELTISHPGFLLTQADNLSLPIESRDQKITQTFSDAYLKKYTNYFIAKQKRYNRAYPDGLGIDSIWQGDTPDDAPMLTIYRHFDSASVHKGALGELPRTLWVIDYPQFERIYYSLVAGYDVFGNISHQTNIRRYMDFLRMEGELNFLTYMPEDRRLDMFKSWYIGDKGIQKLETLDISERKTAVTYATEHPRGEFVERVVNQHLLKSTGIAFDDINYFSEGQQPPDMPTVFNTREDLKVGLRSLTKPGTGFIRHVTNNDANVILLRIITEQGNDIVVSMVVNRWHDNVNSLFNGEQSDPSKDTLDFIRGSIGSYPNMFSVVHRKDLPDFFDLLQNYDRSPKYNAKIARYFVNRADPKFWETYDWFQNHFYESDPVNAGLYDLNRYFSKGWDPKSLSLLDAR